MPRVDSVASRPVEAGSSSKKRQLVHLTSLRGLAAWWVVLFHFKHYLAPYLPSWTLPLIVRGELAVDLFFCLSGFVLYLNYHGLTTTGQGLKSFYLKRFARIYPLHFLVLLTYVAFVIAVVHFSTAHNGGSRYSPVKLVAQILLVQDWGFGALSWNVPSWSISAEFAAYLAFPLLLRSLKCDRSGNTRLILYAATAAATLIAVFGGLHSELGAHINELGVLRCLFQFIIGMTIGEMYLRWTSPRHGVSALLVAAAGTMLILVLIWGFWSALVIPVAWACLIAGFAFDHGIIARVFSIRPLVALGEWSFATYMCHYLFYEVFVILWVRSDMTAPGLAVIATLLSIALCSAFLYRFVERPCQSWVLRAPARFRSSLRHASPLLDDPTAVSPVRPEASAR